MILEMTDEEFEKLLAIEIEAKYNKARSALIKENRVHAFSESLMVAIKEAKRTKECEARITCRNHDEAVLARILIDRYLTDENFVVVDKCDYNLIELINGSCIRIFPEPDPDFFSGEDALKIEEPDGSESVRA